MNLLKSFSVSLFSALLVLSSSTQAATSDIQFLQTLESCQQKQYTSLLNNHSKISALAQTSSAEADTARKLRDKLRSLKKFSKAKIALSKEIKYRNRQGALLSLDSSILALVSEVLSDKAKVSRYKTKLKSNQTYRNQTQLDEIAGANEQVDQNFHEITMKAFILKLTDDRDFQSCVVSAPELRASL